LRWPSRPPDGDAVAALITDERTGFDVFEDVEVHDWDSAAGVR
jgi:hypothetical protein